MSAEFNVDHASTHVFGYYAATQWTGHDVHYFGIQHHGPEDGKNTTGHMAYCVFGEASRPANP